MRVKRLPLPSPWTANAAVLHLYRVWSNRGRAQIRQIVLRNPRMVLALLALWQRDQQQMSDPQHASEPRGVLADIGTWQLCQRQDGSGVIVIEERA